MYQCGNKNFRGVPVKKSLKGTNAIALGESQRNGKAINCVPERDKFADSICKTLIVRFSDANILGCCCRVPPDAISFVALSHRNTQIRSSIGFILLRAVYASGGNRSQGRALCHRLTQTTDLWDARNLKTGNAKSAERIKVFVCRPLENTFSQRPQLPPR